MSSETSRVASFEITRTTSRGFVLEVCFESARGELKLFYIFEVGQITFKHVFFVMAAEINSQTSGVQFK